MSPLPREEATPPVTNTCLTARMLHGLRSYPSGSRPSEPDAPKAPADLVRGRERPGPRPAGRRTLGAVDRRDHPVSVASPARSPASPRRADHDDAARPPSARPVVSPSTTASSTSSPSTTRTSGAARAPSASVSERRRVQALADRAARPRPRPGAARGWRRPRRAAARSARTAGRSASAVVAELLDELLAEGVDQGV